MSSDVETAGCDSRWFVVQCLARKEAHAAAILKETLDLGVYLPEVSRAARGKTVSAALFPGYVFVQMDPRQVGPGLINSTPGVVKLVDFGGGPVAVDAATVEGIRERLAAMNSRGGHPAHGFRPGDPVRLKRGPLRGLDAVFVGPMEPSARVRVLLEFLGRQSEMKVDAAALEPVTSAPGSALHQRGERRTRGAGRKIGNGRR